MKLYNISERKLKTLDLLDIPKSVHNTEAKLYVMDKKEKWENKTYVLKKYYRTNGESFSNKLYTINELIDQRDKIELDELVMPISMLSVGSEVCGYTMPYIPNINFQEVLNSNDFTIEQKVGYLKEIGEILEKIKKVRTYSNVKNFYLNDIHEANFILNTETGKINVVDLDGARINNNQTSFSKYLFLSANLPLVAKYEPLENNIGAAFEVCDNTEYFCYITMIFNYFYGKDFYKMTIEEFYTYITYLVDIGVNKELIDIISSIYENNENRNPYEYLDELIPFYGRCNEMVYKLTRDKIFNFSSKYISVW